jgi:hypothetical protein
MAAADYAYLLPYEWARQFQMFALPTWMLLSRLFRIVRWGKVVDFVNQGRAQLQGEVAIATAPRAEPISRPAQQQTTTQSGLLGKESDSN